MTRKEKREIKRRISDVQYQLNNIKYKLESINDSYHYINSNYTDKRTYYGVKLSGDGFSTAMNLDADYLGDIFAYAESFLLHQKALREDEIQKLEKELDNAEEN